MYNDLLELCDWGRIMYKLVKIMAAAMLIFVSACSDEDNGAKDIVGNGSSVQIFSQTDNKILHKYNIELADNSEKIYHGLMGRTSLDENTGMLFDINLVPKDVDVAFWMKDTLIPLDILFIDENGIVFYIHKNAQPYDTTPIYPPKRPRAVLEINGGQIDKYGINVGDMLKADLFGNN